MSLPGSYTLLGVKISHRHDCTSCATLGHFEVEFWCGTCRYDTHVQCSVQRFIVGAAWKFGFFREQILMKWTETFTEQSQPLGPSFPPGFTSWVLWHNALPCKTLSSRPKVARFCEGVKKARQGDYLTRKQNASPTVGNSRPHHLRKQHRKRSNCTFRVNMQTTIPLLAGILPIQHKIVRARHREETFN